MDQDATGGERKRAYEAFNALVRSHQVAVQAVNLVAVSPGIEHQLAAQVAVHRGIRAKASRARLEAAAETLIDAARVERDSGFQALRGATLVAACGALEYLVKATLVDQASHDPHKVAALLADLKVSLSASDVLGLTQIEQWRAVADEVFIKLGAQTKAMHARMMRMLTEFSLLDMGEPQSQQIRKFLSPEEVRRFNEAYLVRHCLVHNGQRVSSPLARVRGYRLGDVVELEAKRVAPLLSALQKMADGINAFYLLPL